MTRVWLQSNSRALPQNVTVTQETEHLTRIEQSGLCECNCPETAHDSPDYDWQGEEDGYVAAKRACNTEGCTCENWWPY